jgi:hypothetical protein
MCIYPGTTVPVFHLKGSCWNHTWFEFAGDGCHSDPSPNACDPIPRWQMRLQVNGEHFNIGTQNVKIRIRRQVGSALLYEKDGISASKVAGKPGGSFEVKTSINCPRGLLQRVHIYATDKFTNRESDLIYR